MRRLSLAELLDLPADRALIALLEGPRAATGLMILGPDLLSGLIEAQTLGRVLQTPPPRANPRAPMPRWWPIGSMRSWPRWKMR
ncbi:hypothetical protein ACFSHQ_12445 [Gemmobacter lanyuensis]